MLKRQRLSSPISFPDEDTPGADLYEPDSKRRRYFAPHSSSSQRKRDNSHLSDEDSEDGEGRESKRRENHSSKREWHVAAGLYKDANNLLHDLHAEQRHRTLFFPQQPYLPSPADINQATHSSMYSFTKPTSQPTKDSMNIPTDSSAMLPQKYSFERHPPVDGAERQDGQEEADVVTQRYEDSNRLLRALFLSRRKEIGIQEQT